MFVQHCKMVDQICVHYLMKMILVLLAGITLCSLAGVNSISIPLPPALECSVKGQVFQECATCPATCFNPDLLCTAECKPGCGCPSGQLIYTINNKCVEPKQCKLACLKVACPLLACPLGMKKIVPPGQCCPECVDPCDELKCPTGTRCRVDNTLLGGAYCEPSCAIDNGGCPADQKCSLEIVQCVKAPCPPVVKCTPRCPIKGQVYQSCRTCPATCSRPDVICPLGCFPGCGCPPGQLIDNTKGRCVDPSECGRQIPPKICKGIVCPAVACPPGMKPVYHPGECCPSGCETDQLLTA